MRLKTVQQASKKNAAGAQAEPQSVAAVHQPESRGVAGSLLHLQRTHGNRYVQGLLSGAALQHTCACGGSPTMDGECAECRDKRLTLQLGKTSDVLKRSSLASPTHWVAAAAILHDRGVPFEERAALASAIKSLYGQPFLVRMLDLSSHGRTLLDSMGSSGACDPCSAVTGEGSRTEVPEPGEDAAEIDERVANRLASAAKDGQPLDATSRKEMESLLVFNFASVRTHADAQSAVLADALGARAFTVGCDVFFARNQYQPNTAQGRWTLAHELTHVAQQEGGGTLSLSQMGRRSNDAALEHEADRAATAVAYGLPMLVKNRVATATLQAQRACVTREAIPDNYRTIETSGFVGAYFEMNIDWEEPIPTTCECRCGEYRQYVKGLAIVNGVRLTKPLWGGANLEETVYHEDGDGTWRRYGHRDEPEFPSNIFTNPDRATGCSYRGKDRPGVQGPSGTTVDLSLTFKGQTYDVCTSTFGTIHEWDVGFSGTIP